MAVDCEAIIYYDSTSFFFGTKITGTYISVKHVVFLHTHIHRCMHSLFSLMVLYVHRNKGPGKNGIGNESPGPHPCSHSSWVQSTQRYCLLLVLLVCTVSCCFASEINWPLATLWLTIELSPVSTCLQTLLPRGLTMYGYSVNESCACAVF